MALGYCVRNSPSEGTSVLAITAAYYFPKNHDPSCAQPRVAITHKETQLIGTASFGTRPNALLAS